jgi:hypothetical protein
MSNPAPTVAPLDRGDHRLFDLLKRESNVVDPLLEQRLPR